MVLVFDYDGTLHDTKHLYGAAFREAYQMLVDTGYAPDRYYSDDEMARYLGMSPPDMWHDFMPELPEAVWKNASLTVRKGMISGIEEGSAVLYPGVENVLDALSAEGHTLVILSNCYHAYLEAHRKYFGLDKWFCGYYCCEDYCFCPKEEIFRSVREDHPDTSYIVIGDRASDFRAGTENGVPVIGCSYGFGTDEELKMCDAVAADPQELPALIHDLDM